MLTTPKRLFEIGLNGEVAPAAIAAAPTNSLAHTVLLKKPAVLFSTSLKPSPASP